jgi:hypothetical protein
MICLADVAWSKTACKHQRDTPHRFTRTPDNESFFSTSTTLVTHAQHQKQQSNEITMEKQTPRGATNTCKHPYTDTDYTRGENTRKFNTKYKQEKKAIARSVGTTERIPICTTLAYPVLYIGTHKTQTTIKLISGLRSATDRETGKSFTENRSRRLPR